MVWSVMFEMDLWVEMDFVDMNLGPQDTRTSEMQWTYSTDASSLYNCYVLWCEQTRFTHDL
jgi:hypothetical protein